MNLNLNEKIFAVFGSGRGIGKGIANVLLKEGAKVMLTGLDKKELNSTFIEFNKNFPNKILQQYGDLNDEDIRIKVEKQILANWNRIDGIVANAGSVKPVPNWNIHDSDWKWYFSANFDVAIHCVTHFLPYLKQTKGSIVFISSIAGIEDIGAPLPYSSSKAALTMYAKGLARKIAPYKIRVNSVAPGNIAFPGGNWERKQKSDPSGIDKMLLENVPLKQFGSPEDIGNIVAFLLSEKASFITGSCFVVDGGQASSF